MVESKDSENRILNDIEKIGKTLEKVLERIACMETNDAELKMKVDMFIDSSYRNQKEVKYRIEKNEEMIEKNKLKSDQNIKDLKKQLEDSKEKQQEDSKKIAEKQQEDSKKIAEKVNKMIGGLIIAGAIAGLLIRLI